MLDILTLVRMLFVAHNNQWAFCIRRNHPAISKANRPLDTVCFTFLMQHFRSGPPQNRRFRDGHIVVHFMKPSFLYKLVLSIDIAGPQTATRLYQNLGGIMTFANEKRFSKWFLRFILNIIFPPPGRSLLQTRGSAAAANRNKIMKI